jgi:hypothetical protein
VPENAVAAARTEGGKRRGGVHGRPSVTGFSEKREPANADGGCAGRGSVESPRRSP